MPLYLRSDYLQPYILKKKKKKKKKKKERERERDQPIDYNEFSTCI